VYYTTNDSELTPHGSSKCTTNGYAIYLDEDWTVGDALIGGYDTRKIQVVADRNYGLTNCLRSSTWGTVGQIFQLYPFDEKTAFTCEGGNWSSNLKKWDYWPRDTHVFSTNEDAILDAMQTSEDVYTLARLRYGLNTNQLFLGKIGTNIFYWETANPRKVYCRAAGQAEVTNFVSLPGRVIDIYGATRAMKPNFDIGFYTFSESRGWFHYSPCTFEFIEVSLKKANRLK